MPGENLRYVISVDGNGEATLKRFRNELEQTERAGTSFGGAMRTAALGIITFNQGLDLLAKAGRAAAGILESSLGAVIRQGSELQLFSRKFQANVEALSSFQFAAKQAGVELQGLAFGFSNLNKALVDSSKSGTDANKVLVQQLKFTQAQITAFQGDPLKAVLAIADGFNQYEDGAKKAAAARVLFGARGSQTFLALAKEGDELQRNIDLAQRYGAVMTKDMSDAADRAGDAVGQLSLAFEGFRNRLLGNPALLNAIAKALETLADKVADVGGALAEKITPALVKIVEDLSDRLAKLVDSFSAADVVAATADAVGKIGTAFSTVIDIVRGVDNLSPLAKGLLYFTVFGVNPTSVLAAGAIVAGTIAAGTKRDEAAGAQRARDITAAAEAEARANADFPGTLSRREAAKRARDVVGGASLVGGGTASFSGNGVIPTVLTGAAAGTKLRTGLGEDLGGGDKTADRQKLYEALLREAAARYGIDASLFIALVKAESGFNPTAVSNKGAVGLAQVLPSTAGLSSQQLMDPRTNAMAGAKELSRLLEHFKGNESLALAGYNAGQGRVDRAGGIPNIDETKQYVARVLKYRAELFGPDATKAAESFYRKMAEFEDKSLTAGLTGTQKLVAERDQAYREIAQLAKDGSITEQTLAKANLAVWTTYDREITAVYLKEQDKREQAMQSEANTLDQLVTAAAKKQAEEMQRPFLNFAENIQRGFGDLFTTLINGGKITGDTLVATFRQAAGRLVGELASLALSQAFQPIVASFTNAATGGGGGGVAGGAAQVVGSAIGGGGGGGSWLSTLFGGGSSIGGAVSTLSGSVGTGLSSLSNLFSGTQGTLSLLTLGLGLAQQKGGLKLTPLSGGLLGLSALRALGGLAQGTGIGNALVNALGDSSIGQGVAGLFNLTPAYGVAGGAVGPATEAQAAGGIGGAVSNIVSIVGSLYSLYSSLTSSIATNKGFKQATFGDTRANANLTAGSYAGLAVGAGVGAGVGAAVGSAGGPIGTIAGALAGAAIGAAIAEAIHSALATAVEKSTLQGIPKGITQHQLDASINKRLGGSTGDLFGGSTFGHDYKNDLIGIVRIVGLLATFGGSEATGTHSILGKAFSPDIEDIFDKIASHLVGSTSHGQLVLNRRLTVLGQGTTPDQEAQIAAIPGRRIEGFVKLLAVLTGAGTGDQGERLKRFFAIVSNSLAIRSFSTDEAAARLDAAIRGVARGSYFTAVRQTKNIGSDTDVISAQDLAFQRVLPGADLPAIRRVFIQGEPGNATTGKQADITRKDRKASFQAVAESFQGVLSGQTSVEQFGSSLGATAIKTVEEKMAKSFLQSAGGDILTPVTSAVRRGLKRLKKKGYTDENLKAFGDDVSAAAGKTVELVTALTPTIEKLKEVFDIGLKVGLDLQIAAGDLAGATATLEARLAPFIDTLKGFRQLGRDVRSRSAIALAGPGFPAAQAELDQRRQTREEAFSRLSASSPALSRLLTHSSTDPNDLKALLDPKSLPLLKDFADARLSELEGELALAKQLEEAFKAVKEQGQGLLDAIDVQKRGPRALRSQFDRDFAKYQADVKDAGTDPTKLQKAIAEGTDLFQRAGGLFSPGSAEYQSRRDLIEGNTKRETDTTSNLEKYVQFAGDNARAGITSFGKDILPLLDLSTALAGDAVVKEIDKLIGKFEGDDGVIAILGAIKNGLPLKGYALGGPVQAHGPILVGERGPELFVPQTAGTIMPNGSTGGGVNVTIPITVQASQGMDAEAIVATVERAIRQKRGRLVDEIRRATAA